jgi:murein DD-endopeptidase MepM/ murein hydrolase activator NlpD
VLYRLRLSLLLLATLSLSSLAAAETAHKELSLRLTNGFDFPIGAPDAIGYHRSRGFITGRHLGEDWVANGSSNHSLGKPVYSTGRGTVLLARDVHVDWGKVIVIRHAYLENNRVYFIDSLYAHLDQIEVKEGATIERGQKIGTIGNNHGMYSAHLHFEIHKNLKIGVNHTGFKKTLVNYWIPKEFIASRRSLAGKEKKVGLPITHFDIPSPSLFNLKKHYT